MLKPVYTIVTYLRNQTPVFSKLLGISWKKKCTENP